MLTASESNSPPRQFLRASQLMLTAKQKQRLTNRWPKYCRQERQRAFTMQKKAYTFTARKKSGILQMHCRTRQARVFLRLEQNTTQEKSQLI